MLLQRYEEHGEAFLSRTVAGDETWVFHYTPESKAESMTWKHPHSPVKKKFQDSAVSRESDGYCFLDVHGGLLVDFTHTSWFTSKCRCLSANSKETQGGYSAQETRIIDRTTKSSSFSRQCSTSQCCSNVESLELLGLRNSSTYTIQS
jgi:hypothetical protein